jgi:hypothetical protein
MDINTPDTNQGITFQIRTVGTDWDDSVSVKTDDPISLYLKIKLVGTNNPDYLTIALNDPHSVNNEDKNAVITFKDWSNVNIETDPSNDFERKSYNLIGLYLTEVEKEYIIELKNFKTTSTAGNYKCRLINQNETIAQVSILCQASGIPLIAEFKSDNYCVIDGTEINLSWKIIGDYSKLELFYGSQPIAIEEHSHSKKYRVEDKSYQFTLKAYYNNDKAVTKNLSIEFIKTEGFILCAMFNKPLHPLKIYAYNNKLYCLVYNNEDKPLAQAYLYESENGFKNWSPVQIFPGKNDKGEKVRQVEIDIKIAGSPGVVFNDKLWFIGGSSYSTSDNSENNDIYCYNFKNKSIQKVKVTSELFTKRMGHSCLVYNDEEIWVMGGYDPDFGTLDDIWTSKDGETWKRSDLKLPDEGRCMMAACEWQNTIWLFGGFINEPYGEEDNKMFYYDAGNKKWKSAGDKNINNLPSDYHGVGLTVLKDDLILFADSVYRIFVSNSNYNIYKLQEFTLRKRGSLQLTSISSDYSKNNACISFIISVSEGEGVFDINTHNSNNNKYYYLSQ